MFIENIYKIEKYIFNNIVMIEKIPDNEINSMNKLIEDIDLTNDDVKSIKSNKSNNSKRSEAKESQRSNKSSAKNST